MMRFGVNEVFDRSRDIGGLCRNGFGIGHPGMLGMVLGGLFFLGLLVALILVIIAVIRKSRWHHPMSENEGSTAQNKVENVSQEANLSSAVSNALAILNERYAKGEINQEEYLSKKGDLQK